MVSTIVSINCPRCSIDRPEVIFNRCQVIPFGGRSKGDEPVPVPSPCALIMDCFFPCCGGMQIVTEAIGDYPGTPVIAILPKIERSAMLRLLDLGVTGILARENAAEHFPDCVDAVRRGRRYFCNRARNEINRHPLACD